MTRQQTLAWVAEIFEESPDRITPETARSQIAAWDSLGVLVLMAGFNQKFEIVLTNEENAALQSVADILNILEKNGKLAP